MFPAIKQQLGAFAASDDPAALQKGLGYWNAAIQGNKAMAAKLPGGDFWSAFDAEWDRNPATAIDTAKRIRDGYASAAGLDDATRAKHLEDAHDLVRSSLPGELARTYGPGIVGSILAKLPSLTYRMPGTHAPGEPVPAGTDVLTSTIGATANRQYTAALERVVGQQLDAGRDPQAALRIGMQRLSGNFQPSYLGSADPQHPVMAFNPPELHGINERRLMDEAVLARLPNVANESDPEAWLPSADRGAYEDAIRGGKVAYVSTPAGDGWYAFATDRTGAITPLPDGSGNPMVIRPGDVQGTPMARRREVIDKESAEAVAQHGSNLPPAMRGTVAAALSWWRQRSEGILPSQEGNPATAAPPQGFETQGPFGRMIQSYGVDPTERLGRAAMGPPQPTGTAGRMKSLGSKAQPGLGADTGPVPGLVEKGNIDIHNRPVVHNADGSVSTVRSMSIDIDGGRVALIPTVSDDGRIMEPKEAIDTFKRTGRHLGIFRSEDAADRYAVKLHEDQAREYGGRR
jgi:hypothetical protein